MIRSSPAFINPIPSLSALMLSSRLWVRLLGSAVQHVVAHAGVLRAVLVERTLVRLPCALQLQRPVILGTGSHLDLRRSPPGERARARGYALTPGTVEAALLAGLSLLGHDQLCGGQDAGVD